MTADRYRDAHAQPPSVVPVMPVDDNPIYESIQNHATNSKEVVALRAEVKRLNEALMEIAVNRQNFQDRGDDRDRALFHLTCDIAVAALGKVDHSVASNEMVERVARAIYEAPTPTPDGPSSSVARWTFDSPSNEYGREVYRFMARAAIGAMGEKR